MKIISKNLTGLVSFRGVGFLNVGGLQMAVCGSRPVNCGVGLQVRWCDTQLIQVPFEPEIRATYRVRTRANSATNEDPLFYDYDTGKDILFQGVKEGLLLGAASDGSTLFQVVPPLRLTHATAEFDAGDGMYPVWNSSSGSYEVALYLNLVE